MTDSNEPPYQPGAIVNGHQLVVRQDGSQEWVPLQSLGSPVARPSEPKKSRKALWIALGAAAVLVVILVIGGVVALLVTLGTISNRAAQDTDDHWDPPGSAAAEEPELTPEPESAPPEIGSLKNPAPAGTPISTESGDGTSWDQTMAIVANPANDVIAQTNQFNDAAPAGYHYVLVTTTITSTTTDSSKGIPPLFAEWNVQLVDAATGATFEPSTTVVPTELPTNDIFSGQSATGDVAFVVPDTVGALLWTSGGGVFVAL